MSNKTESSFWKISNIIDNNLKTISLLLDQIQKLDRIIDGSSDETLKKEVNSELKNIYKTIGSLINHSKELLEANKSLSNFEFEN